MISTANFFCEETGNWSVLDTAIAKRFWTSSLWLRVFVCIRYTHWYIAVFMVSALNAFQRTSGSCPIFIFAIDCIRPPVPTPWFLPHADLQLATVHFQSQELGHGMHYHPVSPPRRPSPHSSDVWKLFCSSDSCINNINYCLVVLKYLHSAPR